MGADISTIGTNPAGIGLFRGHDLSTSFGMNSTKTESDFGGSMMNDKRNKASFDQIGFVYSTKIGNRTTLRYLNFGLTIIKVVILTSCLLQVECLVGFLKHSRWPI